MEHCNFLSLPGPESYICFCSCGFASLPWDATMRAPSVLLLMLALSMRDAPSHPLTLSLHACTFALYALHALSSLSPLLPTVVLSFSFPRGHLRALSLPHRPLRAGPPSQRGLHRTPPLPLLLQQPSLLSSRPPQFTHAARRWHRPIRMPARARARMACHSIARTRCSPNVPHRSPACQRIAHILHPKCASC